MVNAFNVGAMNLVKTVKLGDQKLKLEIWDSVGQEEYKAVTASQYRDANVVIIVYAINSEYSFA